MSIDAPREAHQLAAMLKQHLSPASKPLTGYFVEEILSPDGRRRADALFAPLGSQRRGQLYGFELKVSRSDLIVELKDPMKCEPWMKFCTKWWLVVNDARMIEGLHIPDEWGVLSPPSGRRTVTMTTLKPAPNLRPVDTTPALATLLARLVYGGDSGETQLRQARADAALQRQIADDERRKRQTAERELRGERVEFDPDHKVIAQIVQATRERLNDFSETERGFNKYRNWYRSLGGLSVERIAELLVELPQLEAIVAEQHSQASWTVDRLNAAADSLRRSAEDAASVLANVSGTD